METIKLPPLISLVRAMEFPKKYGISERLFANALAKHEICWVKTSIGIPWKLDMRMSTHRWIVYGMYQDAPFLKWARKHLPANGVVVDSGANIGQMAMFFSQYAPQGKILAFEPGREQADWLQECMQANPQLPIQLIRKGLSDAPQQLYLSAPEWGTEYHGFVSSFSHKTDHGEVVEVVRLEDELSALGVDHIDLWKLDVELHEIPALKGATSLLKAKKIKALYVEMDDEDDNNHKIYNFLKEFGYHCYSFDFWGNVQRNDHIYKRINGLFLPY